MRARFYVCLLIGLMAGVAGSRARAADAVTTLRLLAPTDVTDVTLSPSSNRVAALFAAGGGQSGLMVFEWHGGQLRALFTTRLPDGRSITSYRWLGDDHLLLTWSDFKENLRLPAVASLSTHAIHFLPPFTTLVKFPWADQRHALMQSGSSCNASGGVFCLLVFDLANGNSERISDPLALLPARFVAISRTLIYASGTDIGGRHREFQLDGQRRWRGVPDGTVDARLAVQNRSNEPSPADQQAAAGSGIPTGTYLYTQPAHHLVGIDGEPPGPTFVALDARLDGIEEMLKKNFPADRAEISGLNDDLTRGMIRLWSTDQPPRYFFFNDEGGLSEFGPFAPRVGPALLGQTHFERQWISDAVVSVTLPPKGTSLRGAVVVPFTVDAYQGEAPLHEFDGSVHVLARGGFAVVRLLAPLPSQFADDAAGAQWRTKLNTQLGSLVALTSRTLLEGAPVCLYGQGLDGDLALAAGTLPHVGCTVAINAIVDSQAQTGRVDTFAPIETNGYAGAGLLLFGSTYGPSTQLLHVTLPAAFGIADNRLRQGVDWASSLPPQVMLAYEMRNPLTAHYAFQARALRDAAHRVGKTVTLLDSSPRQLSNIEARAMNYDAIVEYLQHYYASSAARGS